MDAFELKDRLAEKLGEAESRDLLSFISQHGGGEQAERLVRVETKIDHLATRQKDLEEGLKKTNERTVDIYKKQVVGLRWLISLGLSLIGLAIGILIKVF
jgi:hypothetical protein